MKTFTFSLVALLVGASLGYVASSKLSLSDEMTMSSSEESKPPLYWVAPMDPNYKRDKPGKSPMGMDLIPVYEETSANVEPGTVQIDANVENNLGVKSAEVEYAKLSAQIDTVGYIGFDQSKMWQINPRVSGWIEALNVDAIGEKVKQGDVLFELYSPELVKAQEELLSAYRSGRKALIKGATDRLVSLGVDREQINALKRRGAASQTIAIKAPKDGVIASLSIREGGYLSPAKEALSAGTIDEVWVEAEIFERQSQLVNEGDEVVMKLDALPGKEWVGEVDYIYPVLNASTRTLNVRLKFANPDFELKPNMFASVTLRPELDSSALVIPRESVIRSGGMTRVVLALGDGKYRSARIEVGRESQGQIEVLKGLKQHDRVVTSAHFLLDSESSQTAELSRINGIEAENNTVWAVGEVTDVMPEHHMLTINHRPVPEWDWPGMIMNFNLDPELDMTDLSVGQNIDFEIEKLGSGQYQIIALKSNGEAMVSQVWIDGKISMLMADFGMITIAHDSVSEWSWEAGEMNFTVGDDVSLADFAEEQPVRFLVEKRGSQFELKALEHAGGHQ